jgi:hypothetical protein
MLMESKENNPQSDWEQNFAWFIHIRYLIMFLDRCLCMYHMYWLLCFWTVVYICTTCTNT